MGFLSGVLSNIQGHLGQHKNTLDDAITSLNTNKHLGKKGFNIAIGSVVAGVRGYNKAVEQSNRKVSEPIKTLQECIAQQENKVNRLTGDDEKAVQIADQLADLTIKAASHFLNDLIDAERNSSAVSDLNYKCQSTVNNARNAVKREYERLQMTFDNQSRDLGYRINQVKKDINILEQRVNKLARNGITKLVEEIDNQLTTFMNIINKGPKKELGEWLTNSRKPFNLAAATMYEGIESFKEQYPKIKTELDAITEILDGSGKSSPSNVKLETLVGKITSAVAAVGDTLRGHVQNLEKWKIQAEKTVKNAIRGVDKIVNILDGKEAGDDIKTQKRTDVENAAIALKEQAQILMTAVEEAGDVLGTRVGLAEDAVRQLDEGLRTSLHKIKGRINEGLSQYVQGLANALNKGMETAGSYNQGFIDFKVALHSVATNLYEALDKAGQEDKSFGDGMDRELRSLKVNYKLLAAKSQFKGVKQAFTQDLHDRVEALLPRDDGTGVTSDKVDLKNLVSYDSRATGSKTALVNAIKAIGTDVNKKLDNIKHPADSGTDITKENISTAHVTFDRSFRSFVNHIDRLVNDGDWEGDRSVKDNLTKLQKMLNDDSMNTLYGIDKGLEPITREIGSVQSTDIGHTGGRIHDAIIPVSQQVKALVQASTNTKTPDSELVKLVRSIPEDMQKVSDSIDDVIRVVEDADIQLHQWVISVQKYIATLEPTREQYIRQFTTQLTEDVSLTKSAIIADIRKRYVRSVKRQLAYFNMSSHEILKPLPDMVEEDKHIGFKGFMERLYNSFNENIVPKKETKSVRDLSFAFHNFCSPLHDYLKAEIGRENDDNHAKKHPSSQRSTNNYADAVDCVKNELEKLVNQIRAGNRYDHHVPRLLDGLTDAIDGLHPESFSEPNTPLLETIAHGFRGLVGELRFAYIPSYDCAAYDFKWNADGRKCAKVCLTIIPVLFNELYPLFYHCCNGWKTYRIEGRDNKNELRDYLQKQGYAIDNLKKDHAGREVAVCCNVGFKERNEFDKDAHDFESLDKYITHYEGKGVVSKLFTHLNDYYKVCHLSTSSATRNPSSVYDMLQWLCGLSYNVVYHDLSFDGFSALFDKPEESEDEEGGVSFGDEDEDTLSAYPRNITASDMRDTLTEVCHYSHDVLVGLIGHGHADGIYAVDFNTNSQGFSYPSRYGQCIDMLADILHRLYQQLYFVYCQCCNDEICSGWRGCLYGNAIGGSDWKCNSKQCADQKCNQKVNQTCELHPKCGVKSPLQSYLEDGLPGFLPHSFKKPGCKLECTVSNHRGIPCKTPMGFNEISVMASHTKNGEHLRKVLDAFCGKQDSPLTKLCGYFMCLMQKPPQSLGDVYAYYYSYLAYYTGGFYEVTKSHTHTQAAFKEAINEAYFGNQYEALDPSTLCSSKVHKSSHANGDLISITDCKTGSNKPCGLYVQPLALNTYSYYSNKHKTNHLSWIVYITETFYDLLKKLYDDCCGTCKKPGSRCYEKCCTEGCEVKKAYEAIESKSDNTDAKKLDGKNHDKNCKSIVQCRNTHPNLYKYGFTFGNPLGLSGIANNIATQRTCKDFCEALKLMLGEKSLLIELRKQIDQFLWDIRTNFSITVLALWLLSLLYLLHIMVIRLDLLHIKSHLHSPSSHRIAAQSLLAAARVNKLNRVFYLQP
ncbi:hypothetical protein, conserved [Babesia bigemina]|uniref:C3H1-type domain-containing protein n=1 Tax=Babesia bigemina TaxID=5866 RepID=A0A061BKE2_BABBI|nr:hypothetical protein, conserved [Babesia bigemina]CDR71940.1 hypothetical protein, conserved [Babesia bigemina]|eukprot:XP_012770882.1 hypothetical protein, conserved [Babesia bigemina]